MSIGFYILAQKRSVLETLHKITRLWRMIARARENINGVQALHVREIIITQEKDGQRLLKYYYRTKTLIKNISAPGEINIASTHKLEYYFNRSCEYISMKKRQQYHRRKDHE